MQDLLLVNNYKLADSLAKNLEPLLVNLTDMFFDTSMHLNLVDQLQMSGPRTPPQPLTRDPARTRTDWGFDEVYTHLEDALLTLRNTPSVKVEETPTEGSRWKVQVSASVIKTRIVDVLNEDAASSSVSEADGTKNEAHARLVFQPYVRIHSRLAK